MSSATSAKIITKSVRPVRSMVRISRGVLRIRNQDGMTTEGMFLMKMKRNKILVAGWKRNESISFIIQGYLNIFWNFVCWGHSEFMSETDTTLYLYSIYTPLASIKIKFRLFKISLPNTISEVFMCETTVKVDTWNNKHTYYQQFDHQSTWNMISWEICQEWWERG